MDDIRSVAYGIEIVRKISEVSQLKWSSVIIVTCLLCSCITARGTDDWPMFQHDPQHSGFSLSSMSLSLKEKWVHEGHGKDQMDFVISGKKLFVARWSALSALDIDDGSVLWSFGRESRPELGLRSFPAVANNRVYVSAFQEILCLDAGTGEVLWNYEVKLVHLSSSPIVVNGHIIVGGGYFMDLEVLEYAERVLCLDAVTGEVVWEFYVNDIADYSPVYFDGRIYINEGSNNVYCLDAETGELIWETKMKWTSFADLSLDGERIFVGTFDGVICLELETGDTLWRFDYKERIFNTPSVAYDRVFFGTPDGVVFCLDAECGDVVWRTEIGKGTIGEVLVADGKVVFGTGRGLLYILDAESGEIYESVDLGESPVTALSLSDGKLFIGQLDGKITCFEGSAPRELSSGVLIGIVIALLSIALLLVLWIRTRRR
jgi:hypothetical protein